MSNREADSAPGTPPAFNPNRPRTEMESHILGFHMLMQHRLRERQRCVPSFICVGAPRCGTNTLYELLRAHDEVYVPPVKELNYFGILDRREFGLTFPDYCNYFAGATEETAIGELSPVYLSTAGCAERIFEALGACRIIILLREPFERFVSQYHYHRPWHRMADIDEYAAAALRDFTESTFASAQWFSPAKNLSQSLYARGSEDYVRLFGRENICVATIDELRDLRRFLQKITRFIGVTPPPEVAEVRSNVSQGSGCPAAALAARLRELFAPDLERTARVLDVDLTPYLHACADHVGGVT